MKPATALWRKVTNGTATNITNVLGSTYLLEIVLPDCISMKHCNNVSTLLNQVATKIQFVKQLQLLPLQLQQQGVEKKASFYILHVVKVHSD